MQYVTKKRCSELTNFWFLYKGSHFLVIKSFLFWAGVFLVRIVTSSGPSQLLLQGTPVVPVVRWVLAADHQSIFHPGKTMALLRVKISNQLKLLLKLPKFAKSQPGGPTRIFW